MAGSRTRRPKTAPAGEVTVVMIVRSENLPPFTIDVRVKDQGSARLNQREARAALQRFSTDFAEALQHPSSTLNFNRSHTRGTNPG
jgi:hypothetical protein